MEIEAVPVEQLMTTDLVTVTPDEGVETAASTILEKEAGSLVALDDDGQLSGILTCTDLTELVSNGAVPADATVGDYMTEDVTTTEPDESIQDAAVKMITRQIQHLPVVDGDDEVVGMLSTTDLTAHLTYMDSSGTE
ncbi:CBS domain-containing protein [Halonotius aquaticus]|uniref:CBS domain-containing protein n=1 Tax=Halonotius aquaticus TaxID=2216978 RepID=A0A3A6QDV6_9EURY|nr:CBS domain-containing protein [Halonotius aquaticus]RJX44260.1 CBS domain-containing protein [Halonotius aquaticus]